MSPGSYALLTLVLVYAGCSERLPTKEEVVGRYKGKSHNAVLELNTDSTFCVISKGRYEAAQTTTGTYEIEMSGDFPAVVTNGLVAVNEVSDLSQWRFQSGRNFMPLYTKERNGSFDLEIFNEPNSFVFTRID